MKVKVTKEHITKGKRDNCERCPIALALLEKFNLNKGSVKVGEGIVSIYHDNFVGTTNYILRRGSKFIHRFDNKLPVKPCTVELVSL